MVTTMSDRSPDLGTRQHENFCAVENGVAIREAPEVLGWRTDSGERPTDEWLASKGFYGLIQKPQPEINEREETAKLEPVSAWPVNHDLKTVEQVWSVTMLSDAELEELELKRAENVRLRRLQLLFVSDYTQLPDFDGDRSPWVSYRQQLRDVPSQPGFPWDVVWPTEPSA